MGKDRQIPGFCQTAFSALSQKSSNVPSHLDLYLKYNFHHLPLSCVVSLFR